MASTAQLRQWWANYQCVTSRYARVAFPGEGRTWSLWVAKPAVEAFQVFAGLMGAHGYLFREAAGGTYNCRQIAGSPLYSLHAYAIAIDLNPKANPFRTCTTDMPQQFIDDVLALETENGKRVFTWGGDWRPCDTADPMHFQIDCSPGDLAKGIVFDMPTSDEVRQIIREELDRRRDGRVGPLNETRGIAENISGYPDDRNSNRQVAIRTKAGVDLLVGTVATDEDIDQLVALIHELPDATVAAIKEAL